MTGSMTSLIQAGQRLGRKLAKGNIFWYRVFRRLIRELPLFLPHEEDISFLLRNFGPIRTFVDVGANDGITALGALRGGAEKVVSFEPNPQFFSHLKAIERRFPSRYSFHQLGLSDEERELELHIPSSGGIPLTNFASFSVGEAAKNVEFFLGRKVIKMSGVMVQVRTLDSFGLEPDILKIDVEGLEIEVLDGARHTISKCLPALVLETHRGADHAISRSLRGYEPFEVKGNSLSRNLTRGGINLVWLNPLNARHRDLIDVKTG